MLKFFFEVDLPNRETTIEMEANDYQSACRLLRKRFPSMTGWFCLNTNGSAF
jgi:hypothetical protein